MPKKDPKKDLALLVDLAQKGSADAFGEIYDQLVKSVYRYIYYRVEAEIAEDLTEEAFLKAWQNLKQYKKGQYPFSAWIFRIAHNLVIDHYRKNEPVSEIDENLVDSKAHASPSYTLNVKLNELKLKKAIKQLPASYQQVIILKYINEEENAVIAHTIGKSEGAVRTLQFRALEKLRGILDEGRNDF